MINQSAQQNSPYQAPNPREPREQRQGSELPLILVGESLTLRLRAWLRRVRCVHVAYGCYSSAGF